jgi:glycosyltransferase involved in cell wall biosynthesis
LTSCIVPAFNGERYLREALDSILGQSYRSLEVVVVDDGSTDGTAALVASYGDAVRYLFQPNAGTAAARNRGIEAAHGELLAFLDQDDLWHPEKLARQQARFAARPELEYCVTHVQNFWVPELGQEAERYRGHRLAQPLPGYTCQALLARRGLFERLGGFDVELATADDVDWFLRAADRGAVGELLPDVLVYRRLHQTNQSRRLMNDLPRALKLVVRASLRRKRQLGSGAAAPWTEAADRASPRQA